jgi:hypothetical protein
MIVIYVAGPFRAKNQWGIVENIRKAERYGLMVAEADAMPLIPHANTAHFHGLKSDQFWLSGTLSLLERCDGAIFIPGWQVSSGSRGEWDWCDVVGLPKLDLDLHEFHRPVIEKFVRDIADGEED